MKVKLLHHTPLWVASTAIRTCWDSHNKSDNGGEKDKALINRVGNKYKHSSTLEHLIYTFQIKGISRAVLQELARHRMASLSVKSTRYTLKELKNEDSFILKTDQYTFFDRTRANKYLVFTGKEEINDMAIYALEHVRKLLLNEYSNDQVKYALPEAYKTELVWTINARSLQNFLTLRTSKSALWEIRDLANTIYNNLPNDHKYLFIHCIKEKQ